MVGYAMVGYAIVGVAIAVVAITGAAIAGTTMAGSTPIVVIVGAAPVGPTVGDEKASHRTSHVGDEPDEQIEQGLYNGETYHIFFATWLKYYEFTHLSISLPFFSP